jgi:acyl carrier protein
MEDDVMERDDLERRLIDFVNRMRPDADPPLAIDSETALFEEGVINSLRILDLIAFVEEITRTRIPDAAVRLANFRSVRAIAAAFGGEGSERAFTTPERAHVGGAAEGEAALHVFARRSGRGRFARPVEELTARGELALLPPGRAVFRGTSRRLVCWFDSVVRGWARELGAEVETHPAPLGGVMPPAACYAVYGARKGARLDDTPILVTTRGRCFRDEADFEPSLGRLRVFEMREIVALGSRHEVERFRREMIDRARGLVSELDLAGCIRIASDPFFLQGPGMESRGRRLMQQVLPLKYELQLTLDANCRSCAVASFNHHLDFFGRRFDIHLASGAIAHTGCVAFGLERWVLAFLAQHGTNDRAWPLRAREPTREVLHESCA